MTCSAHHQFDFKPQHYTLTNSDGTVKHAVFPWSQALLDTILALRQKQLIKTWFSSLANVFGRFKNKLQPVAERCIRLCWPLGKSESAVQAPLDQLAIYSQ